MDEWKNTKKAIELTNEQWNTLTCYILMTTKHRKEEKEAWQNLAEETDENGQPRFKNAQSNADFYEKLETELETIRNIIDGRLEG